MSARWIYRVLLSLSLIIAPNSLKSQGFAGLGSDAEGFSMPQRGKALSFPADHGAHPDFRIEWWYVTANLVTQDGQIFGAQWTLFRSALAPGTVAGWNDPQIWIGHAAITSRQRHVTAERLARGGIGQAGVKLGPFDAWIDDWRMQGLSGAGRDAMDRIALTASGNDFAYELELDAQGPVVLQGDDGYSVKSAAGQASHYYSQPFYSVRGTIRLNGALLAVSGKAWLDREWSSQPLARDQTGWDWFSLHLDTGEKLMVFRLRGDDGGYNSGTWITADGRPTPLKNGDIAFTPLRTAKAGGRDLPVEWRIEIPSKGMDIRIAALNERAWMGLTTPYWEGPISFVGSVSGRGYLEMTGY